jgi:hydroxymethylbilane synthase
MTVLTVATRKSQLALAQARAWMRELTRVTSVETAELQVVTTGDRVQDVALSQIGGKGLFIKEIEEALLDRRADVAVHSLKDVPAELAAGLVIGSVPLREDPRDVVVTREGCGFEELRPGAKVGTSSLRRATMLRAWRPDLEYLPIRGNVDTRLRKCAEGVVDAVVLARAGLVRLGLEARVTQVLDPSRCLPAIGQGALAIEARAGDGATHAIVERLTHPETWIAVAAERGLMTAVEGSCQMPVAGYGVREGGELWLRGMLAEPDGSRVRFHELRAPWPSTAAAAAAVGVELGRELKGA